LELHCRQKAGAEQFQNRQVLTLTTGSKGLGDKIFYNFIGIGTRQALPWLFAVEEKIAKRRCQKSLKCCCILTSLIKKPVFHALQQGINAPA